MDIKHISPLLGALDDGYRHRPHEMLGFFISGVMSLCGLSEWHTIPEEIRPKINEAVEVYADIVESSKPFEDVMGPLYMELASRGGRQQLGQYFTPWDVASMMAQVIAGEKPEDTGRLLKVCDPACGSGVMLLAFAHHALFNWGEDALIRLSMTGCDIDAYCSRLTAVQLVANCNIFNFSFGEILVLCGDSLFPEKGMETIVHATAPTVSRVLPAQAPERLTALAEAAHAHPDVYQHELFAA
ncbi:N-6 DNA methylase [Sulfuricystis multivorans]|uniref:N-6 DNA methylase n=1 Tax=Sulfuricystis multivorans TaxID=2211108 RepID=UPI000F8291F5|nr:N-6 DNA methylase [Sulfuricystis multivorans]